MEAEDQKKKFICKFCNKEYPCGKSLGGHLRSHRQDRNRTQFQNVAIGTKSKLSPVDCSPASNNNASEAANYVLRENPKKTWRIAASSGAGERFCRECGKGFQSMKALCGHMASHSDKVSTTTTTKFFGTEEKEKVKEVLDSQSETETTSGPRRGKRSKRVRYKTLDFNSNSSMSLSNPNGSSSVSEIEQEQEEVARSLMMLSRDCCAVFAESSDTNSVVLEAKSSSIDMNKNSDSGCFRNKLKSDHVFVDGSERNCGFSKLKGKNKSGFDPFDTQIESKGSKKLKLQIRAESKNSSKQVATVSDHDQLWETCHNKIENGTASIGEESYKIVHKINGYSICESGENSIEADSFPVPFPRGNNSSSNHKTKGSKSAKKPIHHQQHSSGKSKKRLGAKKSKGHECPICARVFKSGQALGGHKRSHFIGGSDERTLVVQLAKQQVPDISGLLDLNLPAPEEEEENKHAGFMAR